MLPTKKKKKKSGMEQAVSVIIQKLTEGIPLEEIKNIYESELYDIVSDVEFSDIFSYAIEELAQSLKTKSPEIIYAEYFCDMMTLNRHLDYYLNKFRDSGTESKNLRDISGLLKAKIDLYKGIHIEARRELGLLGNVSTNNVGNINVSIFQNLSTDEKKQELIKMSKEIIKLEQEVSKKGLNILDIKNDEVHYGPSIYDNEEKSEIETKVKDTEEEEEE